MMKTFSFGVLALGLISTLASALSPAAPVGGHPPNCPTLCPGKETVRESGAIPLGVSLLLLTTSSPGSADGYAQDLLECETCEPCKSFFTVHFESNGTGLCIAFSRNFTTWTWPFSSFHAGVLVQANCKSAAELWLAIVPCDQLVTDPYSIYTYHLHLSCGCGDIG